MSRCARAERSCSFFIILGPARVPADEQRVGDQPLGEPGPLPQDVDRMVVGTADVGEIRAQTDQASRKLSRDVNVVVLSPDEWDSNPTGFVAHLKSEPQVDLDLLR